MIRYMILSTNILSITSPIRILVYLLILWNFITIIRGFELNFRIFGRLFASPDFMLPFLFPIFAFVKSDLNVFRIINRTIIFLNLIYISILFIYVIAPQLPNIIDSINDYEFFSKRFAYANGFLLLTYFYQNKKVKFLSILVFLVSLIIALFLARRSQVLIFSLFGICSWLLSILYHNKKPILVNVLIYLTVFISSFFVLGPQISNLFKSNFSFFIERLDNNTRDIATDQFYDDMQPIDYFVGRGINGRYITTEDLDYDYEGDTRTDEEKQYRYGIETGYLNIILKGGIIALALTVLISFYAIIKGLFWSNNGYIKASAILILINMIGLYPESAMAFTFRYLLIWICIGLCISNDSSYTDDDIKYTLN